MGVFALYYRDDYDDSDIPVGYVESKDQAEAWIDSPNTGCSRKYFQELRLFEYSFLLKNIVDIQKENNHLKAREIEVKQKEHLAEELMRNFYDGSEGESIQL